LVGAFHHQNLYLLVDHLEGVVGLVVFFAQFAVSPNYLDLYPEFVLPEEQRQAWLRDRKGALVGDVLAKKLGWKVGDTVTLQGSIYPGDWQFQIEGIYGSTRKVVDRSSFFFHWDYLNDSLPEGSPQRDRIGWVTTRIRDPLQAGAISQAIDKAFDEQEIQTRRSEVIRNTAWASLRSTHPTILDALWSTAPAANTSFTG